MCDHWKGNQGLFDGIFSSWGGESEKTNPTRRWGCLHFAGGNLSHMLSRSRATDRFLGLLSGLPTHLSDSLSRNLDAFRATDICRNGQSGPCILDVGNRHIGSIARHQNRNVFAPHLENYD